MQRKAGETLMQSRELRDQARVRQQERIRRELAQLLELGNPGKPRPRR